MRIPLEKHTTHKKKMHHYVYKMLMHFKMGLNKLTLLERQRRVDTAAKVIMSCCINRTNMNDLDDQASFFKKNKELAVDILTVLDGVRERVQNNVCLNLRELTNEFTPINEVDEAVCEAENTKMEGKCEEEVQPNAKKNNDLRKVISMLSEAIQRGYERIRKISCHNSRHQFLKRASIHSIS